MEPPTLRVLIIPGLHNSEAGHWQTWLQGQYRGAKRVQQTDWDTPDLDAWAAQIQHTIAHAHSHTTWIAVAHSFGCLALARYIDQQRATGADPRVGSALLVAPADPVKFGVVHRLPHEGLGIPATLIGSENDPWMPLERAQQWATLWGARFQNLGTVGHINVESGFGPWPLARIKVDQMIREQQRQRRIERAHPLEFHYAV
ncbi:MAG: alpha/beta hydrolase [Burkholderiales bacterium]|nr:alpha/beta hydrolase [Burkholderiales bacterium]